MDPLWLVAAAIVIIPAIPLTAAALIRWRRIRHEKALSFRRKEKMRIVLDPGESVPPRSRGE